MKFDNVQVGTATDALRSPSIGHFVAAPLDVVDTLPSGPVLRQKRDILADTVEHAVKLTQLLNPLVDLVKLVAQ